MRMDTIVSPWRYDAAARHALQLVNLRCPAASRYARIGRVKSRTCSIKRSTTGLKVRFFSVVITTGHGRAGKSTGSTFSELWTTADRGYAVINELLARKLVMSGMERVTRLVFGMSSPRAWNASLKRL